MAKKALELIDQHEAAGRTLSLEAAVATVGKQIGSWQVIVGIDPGVTGAVAVVERVNAMPGEGPAGAFSFGHGAGVLEGVLAALGIPVQQVTPQTWKRHYGLGGQPKSAALAVAARLYPTAPLARRRDIGLADALLIARYGVR